MKNLIYKSRIAIFLIAACLLSSKSIMAQVEAMTITATGTGKTTGDIVALTIYNPTDKEVKESFGPYYIPSEGQYQPYLTMKSGPVTVPPGKTIHITLQGFCADITKPPAGEKDIFKPITTWIKADQNITAPVPPFKTTINPDTNPEQAAPYLLKALEEISKAYDKLSKEGKITTPFSGNPEKEREAVIQQTFWIYTSEMRQKPYTKEQFSTRTYEQFEQKNSINPSTLPNDQKEKIDKGIDDFWNTFQAVGTEAKVLNTPSKPEDEGMIKTISGPVQTTCACGECRVIEGQRIEIYLDKSINRFAGDSIPWTTNQVFIERPEILSTCIPMECLPTKTFEIRTTITYKDKRHPSPPATWKEYSYQMASPIMEQQGEMLIEFRYKCYCAGKFCAEGTTSRKVYFIEKNNCCDSIRAKNNGQLQFNVKGGSVLISGKKMSVNIPPNAPESFDFDFNLEAIFCNLTEDLVFSQLLKLMESKTNGGKTTEFHSTRSVGMGGPSTDPNMSRYYGFGFSKNVNDHEISVFFSVDEKTCSFDVSVFIDDKVYEFSAPPYLSPSQLMTMSNTLGYPSSNQTWTNAMLILSHLSRAHQYKQDAKYLAALRNFLGMLSTKANGLMQTTNNQQLKNSLKTLIDAIPKAIANGDFNALNGIADKMIPILNATN